MLRIKREDWVNFVISDPSDKIMELPLNADSCENPTKLHNMYTASNEYENTSAFNVGITSSHSIVLT